MTKHLKLPRDPNQLAKAIVDLATGVIAKPRRARRAPRAHVIVAAGRDT